MSRTHKPTTDAARQKSRRERVRADGGRIVRAVIDRPTSMHLTRLATGSGETESAVIARAIRALTD